MGLLFQNLHGVLIMSFLLIILSLLFAAFRAEAVQIKILNNCSYTVWAAANPGGGKQLNFGETWTLTNVTGSGRIWGRTNCAFDGVGRGKCESGDCDGLLQCISNGRAPNTVAEYVLNESTKHDEVRISVVEGFNIPMGFKNLTGFFCSQESKCAGDVNEVCPLELRDPGGCNNPCTLFTNSQYCCTSEDVICEPTSYSKFFKDLCPTATTYPADDESGKSTCQSGIDYDVIFCPTNSNEHYNVISSPINPSFNDSGSTFAILNNCPYTVWAAANPGGGKQLNLGQTWIINVTAGTTGGRIWARTGCNFDLAGRGRCQTGDCGGVLECQAYGQPPNTLAEFALNQFNNHDFFDISLVDGFNIPMEFSPTSDRCTSGIKCTADINGQCPKKLKAPGGCNNPCTVFKTDEYCCNSGSCGPTNYSRFFKDGCPDAFTYPMDDKSSTLTCPSGINYKVVFCP